MQNFSSRIVTWQIRHGRHHLPWQLNRDPYRIWLSEIMLQQTQVASVIPYFERFVKHFPDIKALAHATQDAVLALWSGLGYYSRARNLHRTAQQICANHAGQFPQSVETLQSLPGIGRSTAAAIAALAFAHRHAILDGNVKRVLARHAGIAGWPGDKGVEAQLWTVAETRMPKKNIAAYTQGMMDLGSSVCTRARPDCANCPVAGDCVALQQDLVEQLPSPRPKKTLPQKQVRMLLLMKQDQILLQRRPACGIWGGLWSFPELALEADPQLFCKTHLGLHVRNPAMLPVLQHTFTHFKLQIHPLLLRISAGCQPQQSAEQQWLSPDNALNVGLPAPVRKILLQL